MPIGAKLNVYFSIDYENTGKERGNEISLVPTIRCADRGTVCGKTIWGDESPRLSFLKPAWRGEYPVSARRPVPQPLSSLLLPVRE
jgi:hypothetical protein